MQGGYVQLTRSKQRTDLYLTVGPEPLGPDDERPHPAREPRPPEELLARALTRDGSKTLATDVPDVVDVRRLSTRELRAERDRLAQLRATCPADHFRELQLATRRAAEAEQARQQARADHQAAREQVAALAGRWRGRRELATARERLVLADHALRTTTGQADQAAERLNILRRVQQRHLGWMEAHDAQLRAQERSVAREDAWRRRVDQHALTLDPPGAGCWPTSAPSRPTRRSGRCGGWPPRNWMAIGAPTASTTQGRRSIAGAGWLGTGGRRQRPPGSPPRRPMGPAGSRSSSAAASTLIAEETAGSGRRYPVASGTRSTSCWAPNPAGRRPAAAATGRPPRPRSSAWPAGAAIATATSRISTVPTATDPTAPSAAKNAMAARHWQKGAAHGPAPQPR